MHGVAIELDMSKPSFSKFRVDDYWLSTERDRKVKHKHNRTTIGPGGPWDSEGENYGPWMIAQRRSRVSKYKKVTVILQDLRRKVQGKLWLTDPDYLVGDNCCQDFEFKMSITSWICEGAKSSLFKPAIKEALKHGKPDVLAILEPRAVVQLSRSLDFYSCFREDAEGFSRGI
ncbi:hypothetical protein Scep_016775 [Stephania cephalantha]|uniref:Uncharacterized protein n=1 Tax=Stephania cephalantha TaxID=152367 RepID=A0AAP0IQ83_9MAGN